ncbi:MAG: hypothetical protein RJA70_2576 [Pseudomonadota bacterium]
MIVPGLEPLRAAIDSIDQQILRLLTQRIELVLQVGEAKRQHAAPVYDPERERSVLARLAAAAEPPLQPDRARRIFERIIDECRSQEQQHVSVAPKGKT